MAELSEPRRYAAAIMMMCAPTYVSICPVGERSLNRSAKPPFCHTVGSAPDASGAAPSAEAHTAKSGSDRRIIAVRIKAAVFFI